MNLDYYPIILIKVTTFIILSCQSRDLCALLCQEKQKQKLVDIIKCALSEVGCEELPSGCDDHLEQNFLENGFNNEQQVDLCRFMDILILISIVLSLLML